ncbi:MAG: 3-dehydroquinate synthase, partial [Cyanobacteria bacterium P01_A01_bin.3]
WAAQEKIVQKRGMNLAAPLPKGEIGQCGYLNTLTQKELYAAIADYQVVCADYPRQGRGIDPHCRDVGLEDPSTVGHTPAEARAENHAREESIESVQTLSAVSS